MDRCVFLIIFLKAWLTTKEGCGEAKCDAFGTTKERSNWICAIWNGTFLTHIWTVSTCTLIMSHCWVCFSVLQSIIMLVPCVVSGIFPRLSQCHNPFHEAWARERVPFFCSLVCFERRERRKEITTIHLYKKFVCKAKILYTCSHSQSPRSQRSPWAQRPRAQRSLELEQLWALSSEQATVKASKR